MRPKRTEQSWKCCDVRVVLPGREVLVYLNGAVVKSTVHAEKVKFMGVRCFMIRFEFKNNPTVHQ